MCTIRRDVLTVAVLGLLPLAQAWVSPVVISSTRTFAARQIPALFSTTTDSSDKEKEPETANINNSAVVAKADEHEEDDDEYEYIEYEMLTETEYEGSEWMVGTVWDNNKNDIKETWVRLAIDGDKNVAIWGDDAEGTWSLDTASQFLAISKNYLWGKQIWAGVVDDYYFSQGTVRGWTYLTPASVLGQWQARRLGVDSDEAGTAPWFEEDEDEESDETKSLSEAKTESEITSEGEEKE